MRLIQRSRFGWVFGGTLAVAGGIAAAACGGNDFNNCEASRTCGSSAAGAGGAVTAGNGGQNVGGKAGQGGASGFAGSGFGGVSGAKSKGGSGGKGEAGSADDEAGAGNTRETSGAGGTRGGSTSDGGSGAREPMKPAGMGGSEDTAADANAGMGGDATDAGRDTKAPSLLMVTTQGSTAPWPDTGAKGVKADDTIVLVFSEPMDANTAGYASNDLPAGQVDFTWDNTKTRLSIKPLNPLKYAQVSDPTTSGQQYVFVVGTEFHDLAGNALASAKTVVFTTLRHIVHSLPVAPGGGTVITEPASGPNTSSARCDAANDHVIAGEDASGQHFFSVVTFNLSSLPDAIQWNSATLAGTLGASQTSAYGSTRFGTLHAYATSVTPPDAAWDSVGMDLGQFSTHPSQTDGTVNALAAISADYRDRATKRNVSEYMFRFESQTETDDMSGHDQFAYIYCDDLKLELDYVAP